MLHAWRAAGLPLPAYVAGEIPVYGLIAGTFAFALCIVAVTLIATRIAGRSLSDFRLRPLALRPVLIGLLGGVIAISIVMAGLLITHSARVSYAGLAGKEALGYALAWMFGMFCVGIAEELCYRGAPLALLSELTHPILACDLTAVWFAYAHTGNAFENPLGLIQVALFGFVAALSVIRTGSVLWAIGFHAGWDWMLESVYGAVGSGLRFHGSLFITTGTGPRWLTGGNAGPEGSLFSWLVLIVIGGYFLMRRPDRASVATTALDGRGAGIALP
jgi:membrane protease YdiL (CAAX protease family)